MFVNEYIPEADVKRYGIEAIDSRYDRVTVQPDWTVDRGRDIYLRWMRSGREEFATHKEFILGWHGTVIPVELDETGGGVRGGAGWSHYKLLRMDLPASLAAQRREILEDLKAALDAYQGGGVYSTRTTCKTSFDF